MQPFEKLEEQFALWNDLDPAGMVGCASGTAALHLALEAVGLPAGARVITSDFNMVAVPRAIRAAGLEPVFVDCDDRLPMDVRTACAVIKAKAPVHAVIAVHVHGRRCDMNLLADDGPAWIVEDLAEAHGVRPHRRTDAACWSFFRNKIIAGEEGGAVWFRDPKLAALARQLRCLGFTEAHDYMHVPRGWNHRLSNAHAELILASLRTVEMNVERRREIEGWHDELCPDRWRMPTRDAVWVWDLRIGGLTCEHQRAIVQALNKNGIGARMSFKPMTVQPEFCSERQMPGAHAARASREVFHLPVVPGVTTKASVEQAFEIINVMMGEL